MEKAADHRKGRWPRRAAIACAVIFGPALLIGLFGPMFEPDAGDGSYDGVYLVSLANIAATAVAVGVVLVLGYWVAHWLVKSRRIFGTERRKR
jgi:hypothetical protein